MTENGDDMTTLPVSQVDPPRQGALEGVRVLELGAFQVGPLAARWLCQAGAEVIKIEGIPRGDPARGVDSRLMRGRSVTAYNWGFENLNRNKKSIALLLEHEGTRDVIYRLVERADVFVSNLRLPSLQKWGVDYRSLSAVNPRLVYAHGTGFGPKGPDAHKPGLDLIGQARSGYLGLQGNLEEITLLAGIAPCDRVAGLQLAYGVLLALLARSRTGRGQLVDASLLGAGLYLNESELQYAMGTGEATPVFNRKGVANPLRGLYKTKDDRWLVFNMSQGDRYWPEFCRAVDIQHLQFDPRFASMVLRTTHRTELIAILDHVFASKTKEEWEHILSDYNLIWSVVKDLPEAAADVQALENDYLIDGTCEGAAVRIVGPLVGLSEAPLSVVQPAPEMGQHTEEVLLDLCGYSWDDLVHLKEAGITI